MRVFAAVNLPAAEKARLGIVLDELRRSLLPFRWVDHESLHITLKFFGEITAASRAAIRSALIEAAGTRQPFHIQLTGFGSFPSRRRARVLWLGITRSEALENLRAALEMRFERIGFPAEPGPFQPHITLARAKSNSRGVDGSEVERIIRNITYEAIVPVNSIDLMRSHLSARGAQYESIERVILGSAQ